MHLLSLLASGWTIRSVAAHAGVDATSVVRFRYGDDRLMHVATGISRIEPGEMATRTNKPGAEPFVAKVGTVRRIQGLMAQGWSAALIGAAVDRPERWVYNKVNQQGRWVRRSTHDLMVAAALELGSRQGPSPHTRGRALRRGYLPLDHWGDIDLDEAPLVEEEEVEVEYDGPDYDEVVVLRALDADRSVLRGHRGMTAERIEIVRRAQARGWSHSEITDRTGITKPERYVIREEQAG